MRKALLIAAVVAGVIVLALGAALALFDANSFREPIRAQLEKRTGRTVTIGGVGLKIFPLSIRLRDVTVAESPKFAPNERFASVKELSVRVSLSGLLKKQVNVESIRLVQPEVELIRNPAGEWNAQSLGSSSEGGQSGTEVSIADLRIEDARVAITDQQQKRPRTVYPHINAGLRDFAPGKQFAADAEVRFSESGKQRLSLRANGSGKDLDGDISLDSVSLPALLAFTGSATQGVPETTLNGKAKVQSRGGKIAGSGKLDVSEKRLKSPAQVEFELAGDMDQGVWTVPFARLRAGSLAANAKAEVHTKPEPGTISAEVRTTNASVAELLQLASAFGAAGDLQGTGTLTFTATVSGALKDPAIDGSGALLDAKISMPSLRKPIEIQRANIRVGKDSARFDDVAASLGSMHAQGNAGVQNFSHPRIEFTADIDKIDSAEIQQILAPAAPARKASNPISGRGNLHAGIVTYERIAMTDVRAAVALDNGIVRLDPLTCQLFGGAQTGAITVDTRGAESAFEVHARLNKVEANQLLSSATSLRQLLFGTLSGDIDVKAAPKTGQEIVQALNGTVRLQMTDGKLAGVQLLNEAAGVAKLLGYTKRNETFTNIIKLGGTMRLQDGVANTDDLALEFDGGSLAAAGSLGLADQQVKLRLTTILAKELSQRAGGSQLAGLMSTFLSNAKGELVIPSLVTGTFEKPRFQPDPERIAKMKLDGLVPTRDNPNATVSRIQGIFESIRGGKPQGGAQPEQTAGQSQSPAAAPETKPGTKKTILDILDSVRKRPEKK